MEKGRELRASWEGAMVYEGITFLRSAQKPQHLPDLGVARINVDVVLRNQPLHPDVLSLQAPHVLNGGIQEFLHGAR